MAGPTNHVVIAAPRNATTVHTIDASSGTVVGGTSFTPTSGRLLVAVMYGAVTSGLSTGVPATAPTGWTKPATSEAVNNGGLYVWWRVADGTTGDRIVANHNGSNYPVVCEVFEFPAGSSFVKASAANGYASGAAGPALSGLTGTNWIAGAMGGAVGSALTASSVAWDAGAEQSDTWTTTAVTDGYEYSSTALADSVLTSTTFTPTVTATGGGVANYERLNFAVNVASAGSTYAAAGTVAAVSSVAGGVTARFGVAGAVAAVSAVTGDTTRLTRTTAAAGTVSAVSAVSGTVSARLGVAGTVPAVSAVTGSVGAVLQVAGTVTATSAVVGAVTVVSGAQTYPVAGTVAAVSGVSGDVTRVPVVLQVTGTVAAVSGVSGGASVIGGPQTYPVTGVVPVVSGVAGDVTRLPAVLSVSGTVAASSAVAGGVTVIPGPRVISVSGSVVVLSTVTGAIGIVGDAPPAVVRWPYLTAAPNLAGVSGAIRGATMTGTINRAEVTHD